MAAPGIRAMHADELRLLKNFYLQKVIKLNQVSDCSFLTFWAKSDESADPRLFRAVVDPQIGGIEVLLCEIKDGDEMSIPKYHVELRPRLPTRDGDHLSCARLWIPKYHVEFLPRLPTRDGDHLSCALFGLPICSVVGAVDAHGGWAVGDGDVNLGSVESYSKSAGYQSEGVHDLSGLRNSCDIYMDPREAQCGGGVTQFYVDDNSCVRDWAKAALNAYNEEKQKNFYLEKVVKLNLFSMHAYMTFWARSDESVERCLFRGVVDCGNKVLLCEIKDDEEMIVPAGHEEYCPDTPISEEDHSPCSPRNESVFTEGSCW